MSKLSISLRSNKNVEIISLAGSFDATNILDFEHCINSLIANDKINILVDAKDLDFITSAGLGILTVKSTELEKKNGALKIMNLNDDVRKIFEISGCADIIPIFSDEKSALASF